MSHPLNTVQGNYVFFNSGNYIHIFISLYNQLYLLSSNLLSKPGLSLRRALRSLPLWFVLGLCMGGIGTTGDPNAGIRGGAPPWTVNRVDNIISMLLR